MKNHINLKKHLGRKDNFETGKQTYQSTSKQELLSTTNLFLSYDSKLLSLCCFKFPRRQTLFLFCQTHFSNRTMLGWT